MRRKKINEIDSAYHCSIIGTCLTFKEVRTLLELVCGEELSNCTDYILHGMAVNSASGLSRFSNKLTEKLNRKFRLQLHATSRVSGTAELMRYWEDSAAEGDVAGSYWAVFSHPDCDEELMTLAFGEVHMLSHLGGADERSRRGEIKQLNEQLEEEHQHLTAARERIYSLTERLSEAETRVQSSEERIALLERDSAGLKAGNAVSGSSGSSDRLERKYNLSRHRNRILERRIAVKDDEIEQLQTRIKILEKLLAPVSQESCADCCEFEPESEVNLSGRRVLLVGGRASTVPNCRTAVEMMGGEFMHHDGGREQSRAALRSLAFSADIVICALDCVSHDASRCVKKICSGGPQQIIMLKNSGLSSFTRELRKAI